MVVSNGTAYIISNYFTHNTAGVFCWGTCTVDLFFKLSKMQHYLSAVVTANK